MTLNVLTLSTLFPDMSRPNFGVFVERQARELASRPDVTVTVIAPLGVPIWPIGLSSHYAALRALPRKERWQDLTVYRPIFSTIPKIGARMNVRNMTGAILPLVRHLHEQQPFDVIDASFFFPDGPVAQRLSRALGIPYSVKARGADIHYWGRRRDTRGLVKRAGDGASGLLAVSSAMRRSMIKMGMDAEKIRVHYTGVDLDRFEIADRASAKEALGFEGPVILCVGALIPRKGQELLVQALPRLPGVTLLFAGQGQYRRALEKQAEELGVDRRIGFLGSVPHDRLPRIYAAADVMALPSSSEGLANAWVESLACGTPIVITDVGGARELLDRPEAGHIVDRDPDAIVTAIGDILTNPPEREAVRDTALRFTWEANGDLLLHHLKGIARGG
ncbi:Glycoside hydrolase [Sphingobium herbicidovorans NBRC 16415]|uniref:Glycoside hydrolase n=1 Tax=Sphingobium herbicidovorans (strain ATCC 700291 / DSM 11019 / CCUG 56400 / KCTC 2939 / LMG 18315 / NBRC 16415 / MH) TaxID=1219045 RepID=A0A086PAX2_SPHHM|nr:glycosyltransferase [Sphingobium herbicidovorans]KFG90540.1 Glycoside hydrolase [Sphingobium herbicidovorans NBRC 16415]